MSRFEFAERASVALGIPSAKIERKSQQGVESAAYRPPDLTLRMEKMKELGFNPSPELSFQ
jgi:dTDP-4-dehydrorhamnose reductase